MPGNFWPMLNRYWREYPLLVQMVLFVIMIFILAGFFIKVVMPVTVHLFTGIRKFDIQLLTKESHPAEIRAGLISQVLVSLSIFLLPSLLFVYHTTPHVRTYLGLRKPTLYTHWILTVLLILGAMPLMLQIQALMKGIDFGEDTAAVQAASDRLSEALLQMSGPGDLVFVFLGMAVLPAIGEELFFRGIIMRFLAKRNRYFFGNDTGVTTPSGRSKSMFFTISITAVFFTLVHSSVYGMPSILFAGFILGLVYYLTGSLWCSILAHLINNGLQIILIYFSRNNTTLTRIGEADQLPWWLVVSGFFVAGTALYLLWQKRTPLAPGWTDDYLAHEQPETKP